MADKKPCVAFDIQNDNISSGIGQYVRHVANGLAACGRLDIFGVQHKKSTDGFTFKIVKSSFSHRHIYDSRWLSLCCPLTYERVIGIPRCDCAVFPSNMMPSLRVHAPVVAVIHDLLPIRIRDFMRHEGHSEHWFRTYEDRYRRIAERADIVCTVSEYTEQDLIKTYGIESSRICIVPPGVDFATFGATDTVRDCEVKRRLGLPDRYVLYIGSDRAYKNTEGLLRGFATLPVVARRGVHLVFSHTEGTLGALAAKLGISDCTHFLGGVSEADKPSVYRLAAAFAFLSYFEGFGMPVLEAMAAGVPVLVSDRASLPEVAGDYGLVVAPDDVDAIGHALERLLGDSCLRNRLVDGGRRRAQGFNWAFSVSRMELAIRMAMERS